MAVVVLSWLALVGGLMLLVAAVLMERSRRQKPGSVPPLLAPMYVVFSLGIVIQGVVGLVGADSSSWPYLVGTVLYLAGGFGSFIVVMVRRLRQRSR